MPTPERLAQLVMLAAIAALLVLCNLSLPFEVAGVLATGPVAAWALWRADPPRDPANAVLAAAPYLLLTACLLLARLWTGAPAFRPYADLPGFPLTHVAVVLWLVSAALLLRLPNGATRAREALRRAARPALAMLLYVVFGRVLAGSGAASALAGSAAEALGPLAPYAIAPMALLSGMVTGSNVGSNAALMPVQAALGRAATLAGRAGARRPQLRRRGRGGDELRRARPGLRPAGGRHPARPGLAAAGAVHGAGRGAGLRGRVGVALRQAFICKAHRLYRPDRRK